MLLLIQSMLLKCYTAIGLDSDKKLCYRRVAFGLKSLQNYVSGSYIKKHCRYFGSAIDIFNRCLWDLLNLKSKLIVLR